MQIKNHLVVSECVMVFFNKSKIRNVSSEENKWKRQDKNCKTKIKIKDAWTEQRYWAGFWPRAVTLWWRETRAPQEYVDDARKRAPKAFSLLSAYCARVPRSSTRGSAAADRQRSRESRSFSARAKTDVKRSLW